MNIEVAPGRIVTLGQATIDELKNLAAKHAGSLHPEKVVEAAKAKESILHRCFEWNDNEAAHKYRLVQARYMLSVAVEVIPGSKIQSKVFVSLSKDRWNGGGYRTTVDVMSDTQMHQQMLDDALGNMEYFRQKYQSLKELKSVVNVMHETTQRLRSKKSKEKTLAVK